MTDETKHEAMTEQRIEEVRRRAAFCGGVALADVAACLPDIRRLAVKDVPALLSALEEAREDISGLSEDIRKCDAILDAALWEATPGTMAAEVLHERLPRLVAKLDQRIAAHEASERERAAAVAQWHKDQATLDDLTAKIIELTAERNEAQARLADALDSLAKMTEHRDVLAHERDALTLEGANLAARVALLEEALAWVPAAERPTGHFHPDAGTDVEVRADAAEGEAVDKAAGVAPGWHKGLPRNERAERLAARVAELEGALRPCPLVLGDGSRCMRECCPRHTEFRAAAPPEKATPSAGALPWPVTANAMHALSLAFPDVESNSVDNVCGAFTVAECLADSLEAVTCLDCLREIARARAPKAAPNVVERFERLDDEVPITDEEASEVLVEAGIGPERVAAGLRRAMASVADVQVVATSAADPLCARDLGGGRKCGHPLSEHGPGPDGVLDCWHVALGVGVCSCTEFVSAPSGVVDHKTEGEPARTCGTCEDFRAYAADNIKRGQCWHAGRPQFTTHAGNSEPCTVWSLKSGGSTTEGGGR